MGGASGWRRSVESESTLLTYLTTELRATSRAPDTARHIRLLRLIAKHMRRLSVYLVSVLFATGCGQSAPAVTPSTTTATQSVTPNITIRVMPSSPSERIAYLYFGSGHLTSGSVNSLSTVVPAAPGPQSMWLQTEPGSGRYTIALSSVRGSGGGVSASSIAVLSNIETVPGTTVATVQNCLVTIDYSQMARVEIGFFVASSTASLC